MKTKRCLFLTICICIIIFSYFTFLGCSKKKPVKIGFAGTLTGRLSDLGTAGRNGVMLAVEDINKSGGINGHPVELLIRDDKHDPLVSREVSQDLVNEGVVAIIGHMTSVASVASVPVVNKENVVMISPTTSANDLTGIDDYFFRVYSPSRFEINWFQARLNMLFLMTLREKL